MEVAEKQCGRQSATIRLRRCQLNACVLGVDIGALLAFTDFGLTDEERKDLASVDAMLGEVGKTLDRLEESFGLGTTLPAAPKDGLV